VRFEEPPMPTSDPTRTPAMPAPAPQATVLPQAPAHHVFNDDGLHEPGEPRLEDVADERIVNWLHAGLGFEVG
jgi:hypothetical protein